jgi:hypothetical protein
LDAATEKHNKELKDKEDAFKAKEDGLKADLAKLASDAERVKIKNDAELEAQK